MERFRRRWGYWGWDHRSPKIGPYEQVARSDLDSEGCLGHYFPQTHYLATAAAVLSGTMAFLLLPALTRLVINPTSKVDYRWINLGTLMVLLTVVTGMTGWGGLLICSVATGIGLIPVPWGSCRKPKVQNPKPNAQETGC
jgi:hypothetical protein